MVLYQQVPVCVIIHQQLNTISNYFTEFEASMGNYNGYDVAVTSRVHILYRFPSPYIGMSNGLKWTVPWNSGIMRSIYLWIIVNIHRRSNPIGIQKTNVAMEHHETEHVDSSEPTPYQLTEAKRSTIRKTMLFQTKSSLDWCTYMYIYVYIPHKMTMLMRNTSEWFR